MYRMPGICKGCVKELPKCQCITCVEMCWAICHIKEMFITDCPSYKEDWVKVIKYG